MPTDTPVLQRLSQITTREGATAAVMAARELHLAALATSTEATLRLGEALAAASEVGLRSAELADLLGLHKSRISQLIARYHAGAGTDLGKVECPKCGRLIAAGGAMSNHANACTGVTPPA